MVRLSALPARRRRRRRRVTLNARSRVRPRVDLEYCPPHNPASASGRPVEIGGDANLRQNQEWEGVYGSVTCGRGELSILAGPDRGAADRTAGRSLLAAFPPRSTPPGGDGRGVVAECGADGIGSFFHLEGKSPHAQVIHILLCG